MCRLEVISQIVFLQWSHHGLIALVPAGGTIQYARPQGPKRILNRLNPSYWVTSGTAPLHHLSCRLSWQIVAMVTIDAAVMIQPPIVTALYAGLLGLLGLYLALRVVTARRSKSIGYGSVGKNGTDELLLALSRVCAPGCHRHVILHTSL